MTGNTTSRQVFDGQQKYEPEDIVGFTKLKKKNNRLIFAHLSQKVGPIEFISVKWIALPHRIQKKRRDTV